MDTTINTLVQLDIWVVIFQGFTAFVLVLLLRDFALVIMNYILTRFDDMGVRTELYINGELGRVVSIGLSQVTIETKDRMISIPIKKWRSMTKEFPK